MIFEINIAIYYFKIIFYNLVLFISLMKEKKLNILDGYFLTTRRGRFNDNLTLPKLNVVSLVSAIIFQNYFNYCFILSICNIR